MEFITESIMNDVIDEMPENFDSHDFFRKMNRQKPSKYVEELCFYKDRPDPFFVLHPLIARSLASNDRLKKKGKVKSPNIGGKSTSNESWLKLR
jgi:hypothetical protein